MDDFSKAALLRFLDSAVSKGDLNGNTGGGMKSAATKLLEQLSDSSEVLGLDMQALVKQYNNRHPGELSFDSLRVYESRLRKAVEAFERAVKEPTKNPWGAKASSNNPARKNESKRKQGVEQPDSAFVKDGLPLKQTSGPVRLVTEQGTPITNSLTIPYPLRPDFVAQVVIPIGMNHHEARNLANFILALAPASSTSADQTSAAVRQQTANQG